MVRLALAAVEDGYRVIKLKVGLHLSGDQRRLKLARTAVGPDVKIAVDANQRWGVGEDIDWMNGLSQFGIAWIEEPTSPDDILGHAPIRAGIAPIPVSAGDHTHNRVMCRQLMQAGAVDLIKIDSARVGGVKKNLAILLLAAKFGVPVFPHAGGVGLCELVKHLAMADYVAISGSMDDRAIEFVDHLHKYFVTHAVLARGRYRAPMAPGFSAEMLSSSLSDYRFPDGPVWTALSATSRSNPSSHLAHQQPTEQQEEVHS